MLWSSLAAAQVEAAGERVERALRDAFVPVEEVGQQHDLQKNRPRVIYDSVNNAVWIKLVSGSKVGPNGHTFHLHAIAPTVRAWKAVAFQVQPSSALRRETKSSALTQSYGKALELQLVKPLDRNGRGQSKDVMSSSELEDALNEYRAACSAAQAAVRSQLQGLAQQLQVKNLRPFDRTSRRSSVHPQPCLTASSAEMLVQAWLGLVTRLP